MAGTLRHSKNWPDGASVSSVEINPKEAGRKIYELRKSQNRRAATQLSLNLTTTWKNILQTNSGWIPMLAMRRCGQQHKFILS